MKRSLVLKLTLAFLVVSLLGIALVAVLAGQFTRREFRDFTLRQDEPAILTALADYYRQQGSWEGVATSGVLDFLRREGPLPAQSPERAWPFGVILVDPGGAIIAPLRETGPVGVLPAAQLAGGSPVEVERTVVGVLILRPEEPRDFSPLERGMLDRINWAIALAAGGAAVLALLAGSLLARALIRPLHALTRASHSLAQGDLGLQVAVRSHDEIGELATAFNHMSADLARASRLRRQMTADVAHELRTPLSLIRGYAEALRDGVLPPAVETFSLIHDETVRLNRLVEDLRTLSLADAGELTLVRRPAQPADLFERALNAQMIRAQQQDVALKLAVAPGLPAVDVDADRVAQVLGNLLDNALRHTPAGGVIECRAEPAEGGVAVTIADSGPGIAPADLPNIFERFYRADAARQRDGSGSGLGLAIAKSLVEAHGGRIWAEGEPGAGARFTLVLPTAAGPAPASPPPDPTNTPPI
jgi:signal transduction histidine kinase